MRWLPRTSDIGAADAPGTLQRIYVASPCRGDVAANTARACAICRELALAGAAPLAPHLVYPQLLNDADPAEREAGLRAGRVWLEVADAIHVYGPVTAGMRREIQHAYELHIPIRFEETP